MRRRFPAGPLRIRGRATRPGSGHRRGPLRVWSVVAGAALLLGGLSAPAVASKAAPPPAAKAAAADPIAVLVYHGPAAEQEDPVAQATATIKELGAANGITVTESSSP